MESIFKTKDDHCVLCGTKHGLHTHHIYPGAFRNASEKYGLTIRLCWQCHTMTHNKPELMKYWQEKYQRLAMEHYNWSIDEWIDHIGKNFI